jgi:pimeloyl-ACP methyl ester carboxylesterase
VLAIDEIGAGESVIVQSDGSLLPNGDFLNMNETVSALHQVLAQVQAVRFFTHLALVGHSFGSEQSVLVQALYGQADALVVTGWGHTATPFPPVSLPNPFAAPYVPVDFLNAQQTAGLFYYMPETDPAMIQVDQTVLSSTISRGQFTDLENFYGNRLLDRSTAVTSPVLVQFGDNDALYPAAAEAPNEASFWTSSRAVRVVTLPHDIGHCLNAHLDHMDSWTSIDQFLRSLFLF